MRVAAVFAIVLLACGSRTALEGVTDSTPVPPPVECTDAGILNIAEDTAAPPRLQFVDTASVFWLGPEDDRGHSSIRVTPKDGGPTRVVLPGCNCDAFAVDATNVYAAIGGALVAVPKTGGAMVVLAASVTGQARAADDTSVYLCDGTAIYAVPKGGGAQATLATGEHADMFGVDAESVYFRTWGGEYANPHLEIQSIPKTGGQPTVIAAQSAYLGAAALGPAGVYWMSYRPDSDPNYVLYATSKKGGPVATLVMDVRFGAGPLVADGTAVYGPFASQGGQLAAVPLTGGVPVPLPGTHGGVQGYMSPAIVDDEWIYWVAAAEIGGELFRACK